MNTPAPSAPSRSVRITYGIVTITLVLAIGVVVLLTSHRFHYSRLFQAAAEEQTASSQQYTCGMHPWVILPEPGDCPICHMKLVPLTQQAVSTELTIDPAITQRIGVRTHEVALVDDAAYAIHAPALLAWDDTRLREVTVKYTGWVDELAVRTQGQYVEQGQLLARIDSPEIFVAQQEYLSALRRHDHARENQTSPSAAAVELLAAATRRLEYLGLTQSQIDALAKRGESSRTIELYSPAQGYIADEPVRQGAAITPSTVLFRIADLSTIWAMAAVHEKDLHALENGQPVTVTIPAMPDAAFQGKIDHIYPQLDEVTRQARVRIVLENPRGMLRPGMLARATFEVKLPEAQMLIPRQAVLAHGQDRVVMLAMGQGRYRPQPVTLAGQANDDRVIVTQGLSPGQRIVTQSQFLLDSEANMRIALGQMTTQAEDEVTSAKADGQRILTAKEAAAINTMLDRYITISNALAANEVALHDKALALAKAVEALPDMKREEPASIIKHAQSLAAEQDKPLPLKDARVVFLRLSREMIELLEKTGVPETRKTPVHPIECSMYKHGSDLPAGGQWITPKEVVLNPYFGPMMLGCYTDQSTLPIAKVASASEVNE